MLMILIYTVLSCFMGYGMFRLVVKFSKKENRQVSKLPIIFGVSNFLLLVMFTLWFLIDPASFSNEKEIVWNLWMVLFTIFTFYFYLFAVPTSIAMYLISRHHAKVFKTKLNIISSYLNLISSVGLLCLIYFISSKF